MAIDPTTPVTPLVPALPAGAAPDSVPLLQAMARAALANTATQLGEIVGRPASATPRGGAPVEQAGETSTQDAGHAANAPRSQSAPTATQAATLKSPAETRLVRAVRAAAAEAVPRQAGLAPLMADVGAVLERDDLPAEVRRAGRALLARTPDVREITTPEGLKRGVERSGVFLEAKMARAALVSPDTPARPPGPQDLKAALLVFRGALSAWLAKAAPQALDIDQAGEPPAPHAAPPEGDAAPNGPTGRSAAATPPTGAPVRTFATSAAVGLDAAVTLEGEILAAPEPEGPLRPPPSGDVAVEPRSPAAGPPTPSTAARTADALPPAEDEVADPPADPPADPARAPSGPPEDDAIAARFASFVAAPRSPSAPLAQPRADLSALVQLGLMAEESVREETTLAGALPVETRPGLPRAYGAGPSEGARPRGLPPPYAGGPMAGQKPMPPEAPIDLSMTEVVRRLLRGASGALARQDLMQIASLAEPAHHHDAEAVETRPQGARLNLDLPFVTPQGVAVAQFEISHDGGGSGGGVSGPAERTYKARFSIDLEPLGPVHALVTLTGARARVSLWAERAETIARLRAGEESLGAALRQAELTPEVAVHSGAPSSDQGGGSLGHFVDQAS